MIIGMNHGNGFIVSGNKHPVVASQPIQIFDHQLVQGGSNIIAVDM
jgi:hypothetical protein